MPIDPNFKLRKGDVVTVRAVVDHVSVVPAVDPPEKIYVSLEGYYQMVGLDRECLELVQAKFNVGEKAYAKRRHRDVEILAIHGHEAWVGDEHVTFLCELAELERPQPAAPAEPSFGQALANSHRDHPAEPVQPPAAPALEWKPMEGHDPVKAVLEAINAEPRVNGAFKGEL
jgi:hypothetical protein